MKTAIMMALALCLSGLAHAQAQCNSSIELKCATSYLGITKASAVRSIVQKIDRQAAMVLVDTGEPSLDQCQAQLAFTENGAYIQATLDAEMNLNIYATQGNGAFSSVNVQAVVGQPVSMGYDYAKPYQSVDGASIVCTAVRK